MNRVIAALLIFASSTGWAGGVNCRPPYCGSPIDCHPCDEEEVHAGAWEKSLAGWSQAREEWQTVVTDSPGELAKARHRAALLR